jgi:uridylate kinase
MSKTKTLVLSVGGSLIITKKGINLPFLREFRKFILKQVKQGYKFYLVVGGGLTARNYIQAALSTTKISNSACDLVGIKATRLNAELLKVTFGTQAYSEIITDPTLAIKTTKPIVLAGGFKPGWSTDYVAVLLALNNKIETVINLSNIDYVYDHDPRKFPKAKKLKDITWKDFRKIVGNKWQPGLNAPFDPIASRVAAKNKMKVVILNGQKIKNLEQCLLENKFQGTVIS